MPTQLYQNWCQLRQQQPNLFLPDYAALLEVTPAELLLSAQNKETFLLSNNWAELLPAISELGEVIALTYNSSCTQANIGEYNKLSIARNVKTGVVFSRLIDLRFTFGSWYLALAFIDKFKRQSSIDFFNQQGDLIHRVALTENSNSAAWQNLLRLHTIETPAQPASFERSNAMPAATADSSVDIAALQQDWQSLKDPHYFYRLLNKFKLSRLQALRLVQAPWSSAIEKQHLTELFERVVAEKMPLMIFTLNAGCMQIYQGRISNYLWRDASFCILDQQFNLQINSDRIASVWLVRKPNKLGWVTCWEVYDQQEQLVLQIYGVRDSGEPERDDWRQLAQSFN